MEDANDSKIFHDESGEDLEFRYNFVSTPWDDRTTRSKVGIVSLLLAIFVATVACVTYNLVTHFKSAHFDKTISNIHCHFVKLDDYRFVARIHSVDTQKLLCVGAVISTTSVIASEVCTKAGPIRLRVGCPTEPRCKKAFSVDVIDTFYHKGAASDHIILLRSNENMAQCVNVIEIGTTFDWQSPLYIIGRPLQGERLLTRQPARLTPVKNLPEFLKKKADSLYTKCVTDLAKCPVRVGDLIVQNGKVFGLASTTTHMNEQSKFACFANLMVIKQELLEEVGV